MTKEAAMTNSEDLAQSLKVAVGATIGALALSFSTHHVLAPELSRHHEVTKEQLSHHFEREREVLHGHGNYARTRYAQVAGGTE